MSMKYTDYTDESEFLSVLSFGEHEYLLSNVPVTYIKCSVNTENAVKIFCDFLESKKTPKDIFDNVVFNKIEKRYAMSYVFFINYDCVWEAEVFFGSDSNSPSFNDEGNGNSDAVIYSPACCGELKMITESFFPSKNEIFDKKLPVSEPKLTSDEFVKCSSNSISPEKIFKKISNRIPSEICENMAWMPRSKYKDYDHFYLTCEYSCDAGKGFDYKIKSIEPAALLIPIYMIYYTYNGHQYKIAVNGHEYGHSGLFDNDGRVIGNYPCDQTKTKGLFNKISVSKEKRNYKKETRNIFEKKLLSNLKV